MLIGDIAYQSSEWNAFYVERQWKLSLHSWVYHHATEVKRTFYTFERVAFWQLAIDVETDIEKHFLNWHWRLSKMECHIFVDWWHIKKIIHTFKYLTMEIENMVKNKAPYGIQNFVKLIE